MSLSLEVKRKLKGLCFFCLEGLAPVLGRNGPLDKGKVKKVLVIAGGGIGDLMGVLPAIESLRKNFPHASITLLAAPSSCGLLVLYPSRGIIDELISYEPRARHRGLGAKMLLVRSLRKKKFDLSYAPGRGEGMREEMVMNFLIGAPVRLGFSQGKTGFLNTCTAEFSGNVPILRQNLEILRVAGLEVTSAGLDLEVPEKGLRDVYALLERRGIKRGSPFIVIHPGAAWNGAQRCWPVKKYIELIRILIKERAQKVVVIGSRGEKPVGEEILTALSGEPSVINAIGETSLMEMAGLISLSALFIGNDSGPLHLAQAFNVPIVAIFGLTSPKQVIWQEERCVSLQPPSAVPRYLHQYDYKRDKSDGEVFELITVEDVMAGVRRAAEAGI